MNRANIKQSVQQALLTPYLQSVSEITLHPHFTPFLHPLFVVSRSSKPQNADVASWLPAGRVGLLRAAVNTSDVFG